MSTITATAERESATGRLERLGRPAMTGVLPLLRTGGPTATSIQAQNLAPSAAVVPIDR